MTLNNPTQAMHFRYSTKAFDPTKKVSDADFEHIKTVLRYSPSSVNSQPWHFVIANDDAGKARIAKCCEGDFAYNKPKVENASHVVIFASKVAFDNDFLHAMLAQEDTDGRFAKPEHKEQRENVIRSFLNIHRFELKDESHWLAKQVYLNLGMAMFACAELGIDCIAMEGLDLPALDEEFGLREKGYTALFALAIGYRSDDDFNADLPKSRLAKDVIFTNA